MRNPGAKLFKPVRVGNLDLAHRVVLAPMTRFRADDEYVPTPAMVEHYAQRASTPGTLLITEGTIIAPKAGGLLNIPGIWSDAQVEAWKKVADAVHAQGSFIYMQLAAIGRIARPDILSQPDSPVNPGGPYPIVSASDVPLQPDSPEAVKPRPMTHEEILDYIELFGQAAHNAVHRAGFDGVEIHVCHGCLLDQFLQDVSNKRTDEWGGSIENRIRLPLEVTKKIVSVVGQERTGLRLSPFSTAAGMKMDHPYPTHAALAAYLREAYPRFAFLHVIEPRVASDSNREALASESIDFLRAIWKGPDSVKNGSVFISAGGYTLEKAIEGAESHDDLIAFGRHFTANPDLPVRLATDIPLTPYNRSTFYTSTPEGYIDWPFADRETEEQYKAKMVKVIS